MKAAGKKYMANEKHIANLEKLKSFHNGSYGESIRAAIESLKKPSPAEVLAAARREISELRCPDGMDGGWHDGKCDALFVVDEKIKELTDGTE